MKKEKLYKNLPKDKFTPEEIYHIAWGLLGQLELDLFDRSKKNNGLPKSCLDLANIFNYLGTCECEHCRQGYKTLERWLKDIRDKDSFYYLKK